MYTWQETHQCGVRDTYHSPKYYKVTNAGSSAGTDHTLAAFALSCFRWPHEEYNVAPQKGQARPFDARVLVLKVVEQRPA